MKLTSFLLLVFFFFSNVAIVHAQQVFTGMVEYKVLSFENTENKEPERNIPEKLQVFFGKDKVRMQFFRSGTAEKEWMILDTRTDSLYKVSFDNKSYSVTIEKGMEDEYLDLERTDSSKTFFGHRCTGYRVKEKKEKIKDLPEGYVWVADDMITGLQPPRETNPFLMLLAQKNLMLALDLYEGKKKLGSLVPEKINFMQVLPDSVFGLNGYTRTTFYETDMPITDSTTIAMPVDTFPVMVDSAMAAPARVAKKRSSSRKKTAPASTPRKTTKPAARKPAAKNKE